MQPDPVSLAAGGCILAFGLVLMGTHWRSWIRQQREFIDDPRELRHLRARFRRRVQTSSLIALVGVLIPIADLPIVWGQGLLLASILWTAIMSVCAWIGLLAIGDLATTRAHSRAAMARLEAHKDQLMNQLEKLQPGTTTDKP